MVDLVKRTEELEAEVAQLNRALEQLAKKLEKSEAERLLLARILNNLRGRVYSKSSEKLAPGQLEFSFVKELVQEAVKEVEDEESEDGGGKKKGGSRKGRKLRSVGKDVKRERVIHDVDPDLRVCSCCQGPMKKIGEEVTTELDYRPAELILREHVYPKYACCEDGVLQESAPKRPIKKGWAAAGLLAQIIVSKYVDHLPLYRQEKMFRRIGVDLSRSTLCDWTQAMGRFLRPIWEALRGSPPEAGYPW